MSKMKSASFFDEYFRCNLYLFVGRENQNRRRNKKNSTYEII